MLTEKEKTYLVKRINEIANEKIKNYRPAKQDLLTDQEKFTRFSNGNYKIDESLRKNAIDSWWRIFDFGEVKVDSYKEQTRVHSEIRREASRLTDQVMLGADNKDVLNLLNEFVNKEFN